MLPLSTLVDLLKADSTIAGIVADRVFPYDIRRDETPDAYSDPYGYILPTICLDDAGGARPFFSPAVTSQDLLYRWFFVPRTDEGRTQMATLIARTRVLLHNWQDPVSRGLLRLTGDRLGDQQAPMDDGIVDRISFNFTGTLAGVPA